MASTMGHCSNREQRGGLLPLVLVLLQEGYLQQRTHRSHWSESTIKHLETLLTACIPRNTQTDHCPHQSDFSNLRFDEKMRKCACYSLLFLTSLTSISATAWQIAQRWNHPHGWPPALSVLQHLCYFMDAKQCPQHILPTAIHTA